MAPRTTRSMSAQSAIARSETPITSSPKIPRAAVTKSKVQKGVNKPVTTQIKSRKQPPTNPKTAASPKKPLILNPKPAVSPNNTLQDAYAHLIAVNPQMKALIEKHPCATFAPDSAADIVDPFMALSCSIISQQVSGRAASTIRRRFIELFHPGLPATVSSTEELEYFPPPAVVAAADVPFLRSAGLSLRKAEYIQGLAEKFARGELSTERLVSADYDELVERLVAVRGIGLWTVEMFACFGLKRWDVFSTGDLAIQRGMAAFMGKDVARLAKKSGKWRYMTEAEMVEIANRFAPYRSVFMWYMWRVVDDISVEALET